MNRSLELKDQPGQSVKDVSLVAALDEQLAEHGARKKETRLKFEARLAELRRQIALNQREMDTRMRSLDADFAPASNYTPPDEMELGAACHELYRAECRRLNQDEAPLDDELIEAIKLAHGKFAIASHKATFLRDARRKKKSNFGWRRKSWSWILLETLGVPLLFVSTWQQWVENWLMKFELKLRPELLQLVVLGVPIAEPEMRLTSKMSDLLPVSDTNKACTFP